MKTIEEKAKAYDEAIEKLRKFYRDYDTVHLLIDVKEELANIFSELKESEDEKIRKSLLEYLHTLPNHYAHSGVCVPEWLAWLEKQGNEPNWCHHKVDLSNCSEEYCKAYYDGWNNCNMQHSQCKSELDDVVKCLINGMKFYYEDNEEATWGTDKWSMPVKHIIEVLEKQGEPVEINPTEFDTRLQYLIGKFDRLPKEELIGSLSFWMNVVQNDGTYREEKKGEHKPTKNIVETWKDMRLEVYQQASGNRHEPNYSDNTTKMFSLNDIDEIIEKMSEQKSDYRVELKFKVGNSMKTTNEEPLTITKIDDKSCLSGDLSICGFDDIAKWKLVEQKPIDKVEPKFKVDDVIKPKDGGHEPWKIMQVDILDKKYRFKDGYVIHFSQEDNYELVEQKPWSEEDEKLLALSLNNLTELKDRFGEEYGRTGDCIEWLKSLKDRYTWKPTEEQIMVLAKASETYCDRDKNTLYSLYNDLKKLREE